MKKKEGENMNAYDEYKPSNIEGTLMYQGFERVNVDLKCD